MEQLREEYQEAAGAMNHLGYNGDTLDVVPNKAKKAVVRHWRDISGPQFSMLKNFELKVFKKLDIENYSTQ